MNCLVNWHCLPFQREAKRGERSGPFSHQLSIALYFVFLFLAYILRVLFRRLFFPFLQIFKFMRMCEMKRQTTKQTKMKARCAFKKVKKERKIWMGTNLSDTRVVS